MRRTRRRGRARARCAPSGKRHRRRGPRGAPRRALRSRPVGHLLRDSIASGSCATSTLGRHRPAGRSCRVRCASPPWRRSRISRRQRRAARCAPPRAPPTPTCTRGSRRSRDRAPKDALPILIEAAARRERATRLIALSALADQDTPRCSRAPAGGDGSDESIREAAISRIAEWNGPGATRVLIGLLGNPTTRDRALDALALPAPGPSPGSWPRWRPPRTTLPALLVSALARMDRPDARAAIVSALEMTSTAARRAAAEALGALVVREGTGLTRAAEHDRPEARRLRSLALSR